MFIYHKKGEKSVISLNRIKYDEKYTMGIATVKGEQFFTLENPWLDNKVNVSCIPPGVYRIFKRLSPSRGYEVIELKGVPDRTYIQFHVGNRPTETEGCILVGYMGDMFNGVVLNSNNAFSRFMELADGEKYLKVG